METSIRNLHVKFFGTVLLLLTGALFSSNVFAMDFEACSVEEVIIAGENNAHIKLDCVITTRPACAVAGEYFGFDKSTVEGQDYLKMALTAFASGAKLSGYIHQACAPHQGNVALLAHLRMSR